ncbi:MAG TPA: hypothetical protein PKA06_08640 [Gemmatales bacterium]|nr:hypothetical protein [Gemmatales bacterium]
MKITCPECSIQFDVANTLAVKKAKCGECGFVFHVPVNQSGAAHQAGWNGVTENEQPIARAWLSLYVAGITVLLLLL